MDRKQIDKMRTCSHLLPDPGGKVVRECLDEIDRMRGDLARIRDASDTEMADGDFARDIAIKWLC